MSNSTVDVEGGGIRLEWARIGVAALTALLALSLTPAVSVASHGDCQNLFIFQGADPGLGLRRGLNTGFFGCTLDPNDETFNTNLVLPGVQIAIVGVADPFVPLDGTSTLTIGSVITPLTWTHNAIQARWESQSVPVNEFATMTALANLAGGGSFSVTYNTIP